MTEINSKSIEELSESEESLNSESIKTEKSFINQIISLMNNNPNYKMLGALGMMLVNFSVCLLIANWLKHSSLIS